LSGHFRTQALRVARAANLSTFCINPNENLCQMICSAWFAMLPAVLALPINPVVPVQHVIHGMKNAGVNTIEGVTRIVAHPIDYLSDDGGPNGSGAHHVSD
jgi:hypothetical protein